MVAAPVLPASTASPAVGSPVLLSNRVCPQSSETCYFCFFHSSVRQIRKQKQIEDMSNINDYHFRETRRRSIAHFQGRDRYLLL